MKLIAITGGMGTGKTTVLHQFKDFGAHTLDSDEIVHRVYAGNEHVRAQLLERWGPSVFNPDHSVNTAFIADKVFGRTAEKEWLEQLIHPYVWQQIVDTASTSAEPLFCAVPLLFEVGWEASFDVTITVWCDRKTQQQRLRQRGMSGEEITRRQKKQLDLREKLRRADLGIINTGGRDILETQCKLIWLSRAITDKEE